VAHALAHSIHPFAGLVVSGVGAAGLAALALFTFHPVVIVVAVLGTLEFTNEYRLYGLARGEQVARRKAPLAPDDAWRPDASDPPAAGTAADPADASAVASEEQPRAVATPEAAYARMLAAGRLPRGRALVYLALYVSLLMLYGVLIITAIYSPNLAAPMVFGAG
jgi:hypothetical protein